MENFLGQIQPFGFGFAPYGWATCDGQLLPIAQNTALFSLLGTTYGGDGRTTFALPDLRGREIRHVGSGPGLYPVYWGEWDGRDLEWASVSNLPSHNHVAVLRAEQDVADKANPKGHVLATASNKYSVLDTTNVVQLDPRAVVLGNTGNSQPIDIRNPYLGIYMCIAMIGTYPTRS